jgi:uncharacterized protein (TIGR03435 family)
MPTPEIDVVSVKPTPAESARIFRRECKGDRFSAAGMPLSFIIQWSYQLTAARIVGLPEWTTDRATAYNIDAKATGPMTEAQCRLLVQSLLQTRFEMKTHREEREMKVYALTLSKKGLKLREAVPGNKEGVTINGAPYRSATPSEGPAVGLTTAKLADYLSGIPVIGAPVVDRTGLSATYTFDLTFSIDEDNEANEASIWAALEEQLGLKLVPTKAPVAVLVVDHIQKAGPN